MDYFKYQLQNSPVVLNLLLINCIVFLAEIIFDSRFGIHLEDYGAIYYFDSAKYMPWQLITSPFLHADFSHLFFNMFALFMFGCIIEQVMDSKKFLLYYVACAIGASLFVWIVNAVMIYNMDLQPDVIENVKTQGEILLQHNMTYSNPALAHLNKIYNIGTIGASGAIYGVLLAFGMIFPNRLIYLYFIMPIKAKWIVIGYGAIELFLGLNANMYDNVAHFAHLGGMLVGIAILLYWKKTGKINFYNY